MESGLSAGGALPSVDVDTLKHAMGAWTAEWRRWAPAAAGHLVLSDLKTLLETGGSMDVENALNQG